MPQKCFPSPSGVLYISIEKRKNDNTHNCLSVPQWGSLYFNSLYSDKLHRTVWFRPLVGFFIFQLLKEETKDWIDDKFRPLVGFFIFQLLDREMEKLNERQFRPLVGFFIFQLSTWILLQQSCLDRSVPQWGSLYFNCQYHVIKERII